MSVIIKKVGKRGIKTIAIGLLGLMLAFGLSLTTPNNTHLFPSTAQAADNDLLKKKFDDIAKEARGQTVYFYAWGGSEIYNRYIAWVGNETYQRYGVRVKHIRLTDTSLAVNQILHDKQTNNSNGTIDVVWINGANFASMKDRDLLFGSFADKLPNYKLLAVSHNPALLRDFTIPTDGLEMPWGRAYFIFVHDNIKLPQPPLSASELLLFAKQHPGQVTYPAPPDFTGLAFLKQLMLDIGNTNNFQKPFKDMAEARAKTQFLWNYLDELHPYLWQGGKTFPKNESDLLKLYGDGKLALSFSYNAGVANAAMQQKIVPASTAIYYWRKGILANQHYLAIPYNASNAAGAMVFINFLTSPLAQGRKTNPVAWGEPTVLDVNRLNKDDQKIFSEASGPLGSPLGSPLGGPLGSPLGSPTITASILDEPHPAWTAFLEQEWKERYYH